jgi:hypothetical protein
MKLYPEPKMDLANKIVVALAWAAFFVGLYLLWRYPGMFSHVEGDPLLRHGGN